MDHFRFDTLTRTLATNGTRRSLLRGMLGGAALVGLGKDRALAAPDKTTICHQTDNGYNVITVSNAALPAHYEHGDVVYTDCCTDAECAADAYCDAGACTPLCVTEDCPDDEECLNGACAPLACAPPLVPMGHTCQQQPVCADADCPDDQTCQNGACAPLDCPPHLAPINHVCQHPCASRHGHCNTEPEDYNCNCVSTVSGDALCLTGTSVFEGPLGVCFSDAHCQNAGFPGYDWQCLRNPEWEEGGYCYGDPVFCSSDWYLL